MVGRTFVSLPSTLQLLRDKFCLEVSQLQSFELGKTDVSFPEAAQTDDNDIALPANKDDSDVAELKQRVTELEAEMTKVQHILLLHQDGLTSLNTHLGLDSTPADETPPEGPELQRHD